MKSLIKQIQFLKFSFSNISFEKFYITLIIFGIPLNLYKNRFYDNSWTIGEWLISYGGGFVRRGLVGEIIYYLSSKFFISPILIVWLISFISLLLLIILVLNFCKNYFEKSFLLSQIIILAPISGDYFVRKDSFLILLYGLCLLAFKGYYVKDISKITCIFLVNIFSIVAILSHESFGIWGLPSLFLIIYLFERLEKKNIFKSILFSILIFIPSIISFILCWIFKGNLDQSILIHNSWQSLKDILPTLGALNLSNPSGAIAAIGWGTSQVYTNTLLSQFNLFIFWHPGAWLLTIFCVIRLFIGKYKNIYQSSKRFVVCSQLIAFLPMFLFVDIGRWIFMWITSSALLFSFFIQVFGIQNIQFQIQRFKGRKFIEKLIPRFSSLKNYNLVLLFLGIPHCCWSVGRYLVSNPIGFAVKNIIFYFRILFNL